MAAHSVYEDLNRVMKGKLPQFLRIRRTRGDSYDLIAFEIGQNYKMKVNGETVRRWCGGRY